MKNILKALQRLGFNLKYDEDKVSQLVDLQRTLQECCSSEKFENALSELNDVDFVTKQVVLEYAELLSSSNKEFNGQQEIRKKFKELTRYQNLSGVKEMRLTLVLVMVKLGKNLSYTTRCLSQAFRASFMD